MKLGVLYSYWGQDWVCDDYVERAKKIAELGFDVMEVGAAHLIQMNDTQLRELRAVAKDLDLGITSNIGPDKAHDIASKDPEVRKNGIKFLTDILRAMDKVDSRTLAGAMYSYWPCDFVDVDKAGAWERSISSMKEIAKVAEDLGIECALEVLNRYETYIMTDCSEAIAYCEMVGSKNVNILLDTFHMNIEESNMIDAIRKAGDLLGHFHIGEANRNLPGTGSMPWDDIAQALRDINYKKNIVIEPFPKTGGQVGRDIKVWRDLSNNASPEQMDENLKKSLIFLRSKFH